MVSAVETKGSKSDYLLWALVATIVVASISGHYYFASYSLLLRVIALLVAGGVALYVASLTAAGQQAVILWQGAVFEVKKVVWPTRKETIQTTIAVLAMVFVFGLFLWTIDALLRLLVAWLTGHGGV